MNPKPDWPTWSATTGKCITVDSSCSHPLVPVRSGFARQGAVKEPEDHAAAICEIMAVTIADNGLSFGGGRFFGRETPVSRLFKLGEKICFWLEKTCLRLGWKIRADMLNKIRIPVIGFAAYSGTGKTTLLKEIIPLLRGKGIRVGVIKHAHHSFDIDTPGKDSYELRMAGASQTLVASAQREALVVEKQCESEAQLNQLLEKLDQDSLDMILVEGFKDEAFAKIELYREGVGKPPFYPQDTDIIAVATDCELPVATDLPVMNINAANQIVDFLCRRFRLVQIPDVAK